MYKVASNGHQRALHRGRLADWVGDKPEVLSIANQLRALQDETKILQDRIKATTDPAERRQFGLQRFEAQNKIREFKKQHGLGKIRRDGFAQVFVDLAREMIPKLQFEMIRNAATREWDIRKAAEEAGEVDA